jgi:predicted patatin/cPLA2 family phospholipase
MQELAQSQKGLKKDALELSAADDDTLDDFDEDMAAFSEGEQSAVMAMESAQRASQLQASSSLPTLRRELMDIRDLLSN